MRDSVEWVTDAGRFAELEGSWDALLGEGSTPFDRHEWFAAWWEAFGGNDTLSLCVGWRGDRLVAAFPLMRRSGRELVGMANVHTPVFRPLAADSTARDTVVAAALRDGRSGLEAFGVPTADPGLTPLRAHAAGLRMRVVEEAAHVSPIVDTAGAVDDWRATSKPRWGAPLERFRRKMGRDHEAIFTTIQTPRDLGRELDRGLQVEASGWKGRQGTAILSTPETERFYRRIAGAFHERGELRVSAIELDEDLVAFDLTILHRNRLYLVKTGYDEGFRRLAPGLVMRLSVVERCFELGLDAHELLGDDSAWKRKFSTAERAHITFRAFPRGARGLGRYGYRALARPLLKRVRDGVRPQARPARLRQAVSQA